MEETKTAATAEDSTVQHTTDEPAAGKRARNERAVERALERAALRELLAREHDRYAAEDASDQAVIDRLRHERNEIEDARKAQAWKEAVEREVASAERRVDWVDAHAQTAQVKKAFKAARRAALDEYRPIEEQARARMRHERAEQEDARLEIALKQAREDALALAQRHAAWIDSLAVTRAARKAERAAKKVDRAQRRAEHAEKVAAEDHARAERNAIAEAREETVRRVVTERAVATVLRRDAEREGNPVKIERLRAREQELRAIELETIDRIRKERNADEEALRVERHKAAYDRAMAVVAMREERLAAQWAQTLAKRAMNAADRAARKATRDERAAAAHALREERNAQQEARRAESAKLNLDRELMVADLREEYLEYLDREHAIWKRIKAVDKPARAAALAQERKTAAQRRHARLEEEEARFKLIWTMRAERGYDRSLDRDAAYAAAHKAYEAMKASQAEAAAEAAAVAAEAKAQ